MGTKIHAAANGLGQPLKLLLTPGQAADPTQAETWIPEVPFEVALGERSYDRLAVVSALEPQGGVAVRPALTKRTVQRAYARDRYKDRTSIERFGAKVKHERRVARRYEKPARNLRAEVHGASIVVRLR